MEGCIKGQLISGEGTAVCYNSPNFLLLAILLEVRMCYTKQIHCVEKCGAS